MVQNGRAITTFTFEEPGTYEFACHLPGHYQYGMKGTIEVVPATLTRGQPSSPAKNGVRCPDTIARWPSHSSV